MHCKAGLGRTGTCIGAYMMKHHKLTAEEAIGWLRIVRPGSVIGQQQQYMKDMQAKLWREGDLYQARMKQKLDVTVPTEPRQGHVGSSHRSRRKLSGGPGASASLSSDMKNMSLGSALARNSGDRDESDIAAEEAEGVEATQGDLLRMQRAAAAKGHGTHGGSALPSIHMATSTTTVSAASTPTSKREKTPPVSGGSSGGMSSLFSRNGKSGTPTGKSTPPVSGSPISRFMSSFRDK